MVSTNFSLPAFGRTSVGCSLPVKTQGTSGYTTSLGQECSDVVSIAFSGKGKGIKREPEGSPVEDSDGSGEVNLNDIPEHPLSRVHNLVRDVLGNFGDEKTVFPKSSRNSANARGKRRPEVQYAISETRKTLKRLPSIELAQQVKELQRIAEEKAPGKASKNWFNRKSLGLERGGFSRDRYYGKTRAQEVIPQEEQDLSRDFDDYITKQLQTKTHDPRGYVMDPSYLERSHDAHESNLARIYSELKQQGLLGTPKEQQAYREAEEARQRWLTDRVVSRLPGHPVSDFFGFELQTNAPSPNHEYRDPTGNRVYPIFSPAGRFVGWSRNPQLRGG